MRELTTGPSQHQAQTNFSDPIAYGAGTVMFSPVEVSHSTTAYGIVVFHGAVAGGNLYVALYDDLNYAPNNRIAVSASVAASGVTQMQYIPFTVPLNLVAGLYWCALEPDVDDEYLTQVNTLFTFPANINNGLPWYRQVLGAYAIPPAVAGPLTFANDRASTFVMRLRVAAV
jgi:hypothetical protein